MPRVTRSGIGRVVRWLLLALCLATSVQSLEAAEARPAASQLLKEADQAARKGEHKKAIRSYRKLMKWYPDSPEAPRAQYLMGVVWEAAEEPLKAAQAYGDLLSRYPASKDVDEAVKSLIQIGNELKQAKEGGRLKRAFTRSPLERAIDVFHKVVENVPYDKRSAELRYQIGWCAFQLRDYGQAVTEWDIVVKQYALSEWVEKASFGAAEATFCQIPPSGYDPTFVDEAERRLSRFVTVYPESSLASKAKELHQAVLERKAEYQFSVAKFYEKKWSYGAARSIYRTIEKDYPGTHWAREASERLKAIAGQPDKVEKKPGAKK